MKNYEQAYQTISNHNNHLPPDSELAEVIAETDVLEDIIAHSKKDYSKDIKNLYKDLKVKRNELKKNLKRKPRWLRFLA